jgi:hypothetical protein
MLHQRNLLGTLLTEAQHAWHHRTIPPTVFLCGIMHHARLARRCTLKPQSLLVRVQQAWAQLPSNTDAWVQRGCSG